MRVSPKTTDCRLPRRWVEKGPGKPIDFPFPWRNLGLHDMPRHFAGAASAAATCHLLLATLFTLPLHSNLKRAILCF